MSDTDFANTYFLAVILTAIFALIIYFKFIRKNNKK